MCDSQRATQARIGGAAVISGCCQTLPENLSWASGQNCWPAIGRLLHEAAPTKSAGYCAIAAGAAEIGFEIRG